MHKHQNMNSLSEGGQCQAALLLLFIVVEELEPAFQNRSILPIHNGLMVSAAETEV